MKDWKPRKGFEQLQVTELGGCQNYYLLSYHPLKPMLLINITKTSLCRRFPPPHQNR